MSCWGLELHSMGTRFEFQIHIYPIVIPLLVFFLPHRLFLEQWLNHANADFLQQYNLCPANEPEVLTALDGMCIDVAFRTGVKGNLEHPEIVISAWCFNRNLICHAYGCVHMVGCTEMKVIWRQTCNLVR